MKLWMLVCVHYSHSNVSLFFVNAHVVGWKDLYARLNNIISLRFQVNKQLENVEGFCSHTFNTHQAEQSSLRTPISERFLLIETTNGIHVVYDPCMQVWMKHLGNWIIKGHCVVVGVLEANNFKRCQHFFLYIYRQRNTQAKPLSFNCLYNFVLKVTNCMARRVAA